MSINPYTKALPVVYSGELEVDGALVDKPSRRYILAQQAWQAGDHERLRNLGIGVVYADGVITETGAGPETVPWGGMPAGLAPGCWCCGGSCETAQHGKRARRENSQGAENS